VRRLRDLFCCIVVLGCQPALSAQLSISGQGYDLKTVVSGVAFPTRLPQDLKSGLSNNILIRLELLHDSQIDAQADVLLAVRYDLWEEVFSITETSGSLTVLHEELGTVDKVMDFLSRISVPDVLGLEKRPTTGIYRLRARILLNPIDKERLDNLQKWVAENAGSVGSENTGAPGELGAGLTAPAGAPAPNSLCNRIFRGYSGTGAAATWLETVESRPFTVKELSHDGK
jgi:hypothetical protein